MISNLLLQTLLLGTITETTTAFTCRNFQNGYTRITLGPKYTTTNLSMLFGGRSNKEDKGNSNEKSEIRSIEFDITTDEPPQSPERQLRLQRELRNKAHFKDGNELIRMRQLLADYENELRLAVEKGKNDVHVENLRNKIISLRSKDAEYVYGQALKLATVARNRGKYEEEAMHLEDADNARSCIPHFNIEGLWVGKYGSHGYEMINVTYTGDTLIAYKVTGDKNVPKGEVSFKADLSPTFHSGAQNALKPIELTESASKQWGTDQLTRFPGQGQVAAEGFLNSQWMEGQLILVGDYFSFAWIPLGHQIFFGRPSPELTLKMITESITATVTDDVERMREHATRCLDSSDEIEMECSFEEDLPPEECWQ